MSQQEKNTTISMNHQEVLRYLPHRSPFLLVDRVESLVSGKEIHAIKAVSGIDPYFEGHFPGNPLFPGVYIIEGLAQAAGILCFKTQELLGHDFEKKCVLTGVQEAKFRKPVLPGDTLHYKVTVEKSRGPFFWLNGTALVDQQVVAEVKLSAMMGSPKS